MERAADIAAAVAFLMVTGALAVAMGRVISRMMGRDGKPNPRLKHLPRRGRPAAKHYRPPFN